MNQPHPPSPAQQQTAAVLQLQQSCWGSSSHQPPRTVSNTSLSAFSSSSPLSAATVDHSSHNARKRRRRRNVHFASTSNLLSIPSKSSENKESFWYTQQDYAKFKRDARFFSKAMAKSSCVDTLESIAYSLATKAPTPLHHVHPHEQILSRGIEHTLSPTVQKLLIHRRKVLIRKVLCKQASSRKELSVSGMNKKELEWIMSEELAQCSRAGSEFAKDWAVLKLLHH